MRWQPLLEHEYEMCCTLLLFILALDCDSMSRYVYVYGAVTLLLITVLYRPSSNARAQSLALGWKARLNQLDPIGLLIFLPMIVCLLLALQWGGSQYDWGSGRIIALLVLFAVGIPIFVGVQFWQKDNATLPPRVLEQRSVAAGAWFSLMLGGSFYTFVYYQANKGRPIWFQAIKGVSPVRSGIMNIPMVLALVIFSVLAGGLVTKLGYYTPFVYASAVLMSIGAGLLSTFTTETGSPKWIGYQVIYGAGVGLGLQQPLVAVQTVPYERRRTDRNPSDHVQSDGRRCCLRLSRAECLHQRAAQRATTDCTPDRCRSHHIGRSDCHQTSRCRTVAPRRSASVQWRYRDVLLRGSCACCALGDRRCVALLEERQGQRGA